VPSLPPFVIALAAVFVIEAAIFGRLRRMAARRGLLMVVRPAPVGAALKRFSMTHHWRAPFA
jgi:hypothetical protein